MFQRSQFIVVLFCVAFHGTAIAQPVDCAGRRIPLTVSSSSRPYVHMRIGDHEGMVMLDTGAGLSHIDAATFGVTPGSSVRLNGSSLPTLSSGVFHSTNTLQDSKFWGKADWHDRDRSSRPPDRGFSLRYRSTLRHSFVAALSEPGVRGGRLHRHSPTGSLRSGSATRSSPHGKHPRHIHSHWNGDGSSLDRYGGCRSSTAPRRGSDQRCSLSEAACRRHPDASGRYGENH